MLTNWWEANKYNVTSGLDFIYLDRISLERNILKAKSLGLVKDLEHYQLEKALVSD